MSCLLQDLFDAFNNVGVVPTWRGSSRAWKRTSDLLDVDSLARLYWLNEITKNGDGFRFSSTYLYKDRGEGSKIKFGPAWDFDLSLGTKQSLITDGLLRTRMVGGPVSRGFRLASLTIPRWLMPSIEARVR